MLNRFFIWFYCLDILVILCITAMASWMFRLLHRRLEDRRWWKPLLALLWMLWAAAVVYATLLCRSRSTVAEPQWSLLHSYLEVLNGGSREILRASFLNAVMFLPAGLLLGGLLPEKWPGFRRVMLGCLLCLIFSAGIEYLQFTRMLGRAEIDDVLHNTIGTVAGLLWMHRKDS